MAAPYTPQLSVELGLGSSPFDDIITWTDVTSQTQADVTISRGRPTEFDRFKPGALSLTLTDASRDLDPTNLSGTYVQTDSTQRFPLYVGSPASETGTSLGTDNTVTLPAGVTVGELLIAYVTVDLNGGATGVSTGTGSAVWTELFDDANGTIVRHACYARIATGSDALVLTGSTEDYVVQVIRVTHHGCATTADIEVGTTVASSGTGVDPPSLNAGGTGKWLWIAMAGVDCTSTTLFTGNVGTGFTAIDQEISAVSTSSVGLTWAWMQDEVSTKDPGQMATNFSRDWVANTIAVPQGTVSVDRTQIVPNVPVRVVATLAAREEVFADPATGPTVHTGWRVEAGGITTVPSGEYVIPTGTVLRGPGFNFDGDASFQWGTIVDGASPDHDVRIVLANGGYIGWNLTGTTLTYAVNDGGSTADDTVVWSDANMRFLRVVFNGDDLIWQRSADASSWTTIDTYTRGSDFANTVDWSFGYLYVENHATTSPQLDEFSVEVSRFTLFTGSVDSWQWTPLPGKAAGVVHVRASDAFKLWASTAVPHIWRSTVESHSPEVWYQLAEPFPGVGVVPAYDASGNDRHGSYPAIGVGRSEPLTPLIGSGGAWFPPKNTLPGIRLPDTARVPDAGDYTFNCWVQATERFPDQGAAQFGNLAAMSIFTQAALGGDNNILRVAVQARDDLDETDPNNPVITHWVVTVYAVGNWGSYIADFEATIEDALPHMITWSVSSAGALAMYVDSARVPVYHEYAGFGGSLIGTYIGNDVAAVGTPNGYSFSGAVDEVAWFPAVLTQAQVSALYEAATVPWDGDTTGQRINRVLDLIGWPSNLRLIDNGEVTLGPADVEGRDVLSYLQDVETSEGGRLFIGPRGEVVFHDRRRCLLRGTDPVLFDTASAGVDILGAGFTIAVDDTFLFTSAAVSSPGGDEKTYSDAAAVARYGERRYTASTLARSDVEAYMRAAGVVARYKEPQPRLGAWQAAPEKDPTMWPSMLSLDLGDTVRLTFQLLGAGDTFDDYLDLAEVTTRVAGGAWTYELAATPQHPDTGGFFSWDTDGQGWQLAPWAG